MHAAGVLICPKAAEEYVPLQRGADGSITTQFVMTTLEELDMTGVQWSIDTLDWKGLSAKQIYDRVVPKAKSGDIVLFHNNSDHVLDALPIVLAALKKDGFRFVKLSELVATENFSVDNNGIQHKNI